MVYLESQTKVVKEILNRMETRKSFLLSLVFFSQNEGSHLPQAKKELSKIISLLENVDLTLGQDIPDAFDPNINRKLTSQTPPRPVELVSEEQSFTDFNLLIQRLLSICDVADFPSVTSLMVKFINTKKKIDILKLFLVRITSLVSVQFNLILMHFQDQN